MTQPQSRQSQSLKGLSTLALLKTNFDAGKDHIDMFQPFVDDVVCTQSVEGFTLENAKSALESKHGLKVPSATLSTLLARACRRGLIRKEGGIYLRDHEVHHLDIESERRRIDEEHHALAARMRDFFAQSGLPIQSDDEALNLLLSFVSENQLELLLDAFTTGPGHEGLSKREARLVARFITEVCLRDALLADYLQRLLEGFVLQNALLLKDISTADRRFRRLVVFFDSGFLFGALGLLGDSVKTASREGLDLLRSLGVKLGVFDKTIDEMTRILSVYERNLATAEGRTSLYPTELTRHLITHSYTPSDVREVIALLERNLSALALVITPTPKRDRRFTLDEKDLEGRLESSSRRPKEHRIVHDVDCVAAILTVRSGRTSNTVDDSHAIFATDSRIVVRTVQEWYRAMRASGIAPVINYITLSNIAWLKKPASASKLKLNELVALCTAALRPSRKTWDAFLAHLRRLEKDGTVTSDEAIAVVANELTDRLLAEIDDDSEIQQQTLSSVLDRVKSSYKEEAYRFVQQVRSDAAEDFARLKEDADKKIAALRDESEKEKSSLHESLLAERNKLGSVEERLRQVELRVRARSARWARRASWGITATLVLALTLAVGTTLPGVIDRLGGSWRWVGLAGSAVLAVVTALTLIRGGHLLDWLAGLESALERRFRVWLAGDAASSGSVTNGYPDHSAESTRVLPSNQTPPTPE